MLLHFLRLKRLWLVLLAPEKVNPGCLSFLAQRSIDGLLDGRIILSLAGDSKYPEEVEIKYQLLNPSTTFREVVDSARSVILAGGTMSPVTVVCDHRVLRANNVKDVGCDHSAIRLVTF